MMNVLVSINCYYVMSLSFEGSRVFNSLTLRAFISPMMAINI